MPAIIKKYLFLISTIFIVGLIALGIRKYLTEFKYFSIACSIYEKNGHLLFQVPNHLACAYAKNGNLLAISNDETEISLFDKNQTALWTHKAFLHHQPRITEDQQSVLFIDIKIVKLDGQNVIDKCIVRRSIENQPLGEWCISKNMVELKTRGLVFKHLEFVGEQNFNGVKVSNEISHINSVFELPDSPLSRLNPAFQKGNFLVNLQRPSRGMLILDRDLKNILWVDSFFNFPIHNKIERITTHDTQINSEGHMLTYANYAWIVSSTATNFEESQSIYDTFPYPKRLDYNFFNNDYRLINSILLYTFVNVDEQERYTRLLEFDPFTHEIFFEYQDTPKKNFSSAFMGSINKLKNGHYLYSDITHGGEAFEIDRAGEKIWSFTNPQKEADGSPIKFLYINPVYDLSFLEARNLLQPQKN